MNNLDQHHQRAFQIRGHFLASASAATLEEAAAHVSEAAYLLALVGDQRLEQPELGELLDAVEAAGARLIELAPAHYASVVASGFSGAAGVLLWWASSDADRQLLNDRIADDQGALRILRNAAHNLVLAAEINARVQRRKVAKVVNLSAERERRGGER